MAEQTREISKKHARRINQIRRIVILLIVAGILIPTVLCIYLLARVSSLEEKIADLYATREARMEMGKAERNLALVENPDSEVQLVQQVSAQGAEQGILTEQESEKDGQAADGNSAADGVKHVYLTFDDGPSVMTDEILDILKEHDVKATFFVNGREDDESLRLYQRIVDEGHTLGMHSYSHEYNAVYASKEAFIDDTLRLQVLLTEVTGVCPVYYRFPGGSSNRIGGADIHELIDWLDEQGIEYFDWNITSGDALGVGLSAQQIYVNCTSSIQNHADPVIILMHDSGAKRSTVAALPSVIERIQAMEGVELCAITTDTKPVHHVE